jgi:purine-cytosine permease-like protein
VGQPWGEPALPKQAYVLLAGVITGLLSLRPLGAIRVLRKYAAGAVLVVLCYLFVQLMRHPLPGFTQGTWSGYWAATDTVVAVAVSTQNLRPLWDRRILAAVIAAATTAGALWLNVADYENFLDLIGALFVPLSAVLIADYFVTSRGRWDLSAAARSRPLMLLPWAAGFVTYQLINPGYVSWWTTAWTSFGHDIGFTPASWMSASILSFAVAAAITLVVGWLPGRRARPI